MAVLVLKYIIGLDIEFNEIGNLINILRSRSSLEIEYEPKKELIDSLDTSIILVNDKSKYPSKIQKINANSKSNKQYYILTYELSDIDSAKKINRETNKVLHSFEDVQVTLINDGISKYYSVKAYEKLHDVENMIRAFITELMAFYGNPDWVKKEAKSILNLRDDDISKGSRILYSRNFDQLKDFLFTDYSETSYKEIVLEILNLNNKKNIEELIKDINSMIPRTNWEKLLESKANKKMISGDHYKNLLENIYGKRNKIAHCNEFTESDYIKFNKDCDEIIKQTEMLIQMIESNEDNKNTIDSSIEEDVSAIFSPLNKFDTIVVPSNEQGFKDVFLKEEMWYSVSIYEGRIDYIKYIAAYITSPIKKITHYAEVDKIEPSPYNEKKKIIYFKNSPIKLKNPITLGQDKNAFQRSRYTNFNKLMEAKNSDQLF